MSTTTKNLGAVTAYKYAVNGGFQGTEAEFEALLANLPAVDDTAGEGDTDKVWSADKTYSEFSDVKSAIHPSVITPASGSTFTLDPCPVTYDFGEMAELTVTVTADTQYHFAFECPSSAATVLTMTGITGTCGDTVEAGKRYEVDVWAGVAVIIETEVTAV